jgi:hypothetical protein
MRPVALLADGDQTIPQVVCLSIPVAGGATMRPHAPRSSSLVRGQGSFPCTPILRKPRISGPKEIAPGPALVAPGVPFVMFLGPHVRAQHPCMCPPWAIKGRACNVTRKGWRKRLTQTDSLGLSHSQVHTNSQAQYITQWSRVLRSDGPNHSKSLCVLVFFPFPPNRQNA